jgi:LPS-assembly protein
MPRPSRLLKAATATALGLANAHGAIAADAVSYENLPRCPDDAAARATAAAPPRQRSAEQDQTIEFGTFSADPDSKVQVGGGVIFRQGDRELRTDSLTISEDARRVEVEGGLEYRDPELVVRGRSGRLVGEETTFEGARFELPQKPARGGADSLVVNSEGQLKLEGVQYTTCPEGQDDWRILADKVEIDPQRGTGTARDARVELFGVPLLRLPVISFPVGNARKSGLLFPSIGSSTSGGVEFSIPYYFNIAPQQDFTLTPTWYSNRGIDFGGQYRYLLRSGHGAVEGNLLPGDDRTGDTRSRVKLQTLNELPGHWRLTVDAENVSDTRYLEDFARGTNDASIAFLPRQALLAYRDDHLDLGLMWRNFQTLDAELAQTDRPHTELPRLFARGDWRRDGRLPLEYGATAEVVNFLHSEDVQGWRLNAAPQAALDFRGAGWFVRPAAAVDATYYNLTDVAPGARTTPSRTLPMASLDTGLMFEAINGRNRQRRITLEPRLMYLYVPYKDQSDLPVFDTGEPDLNWVELFRPNRFVGIDRISDANQVSAGVTTQLYSSRTGQRYISATLGQTFYLETPRVLLPDEPPDTGHTSDLIAEIELAAFRNWNVNTAWQWDPQGEQTERAEVRLQYRPESRQVLNFGYRYQRGRTEQTEFSAAWPISENWRLYGRTLYSVRDSKFIDNFAGFEYSSCCWALRAVARDYVGRRTGERDRSIYLQLELKGLSNVGLAADAFLERSIRGYSSRQRR